MILTLPCAPCAGSPLPSYEKYPEFSIIQDVSFVTQLSRYAGVAIASLEQLYQIMSKQDRLDSVVKIITQLSDDDTGQMLLHLFEDAKDICDAETINLYTRNSQKMTLNLAFSTLDTDSVETEIPVDQESIPGIVAWTGHTMCVTRGRGKPVKESSNFSYETMLHQDTHSVLCVPVLFDKNVDAVILASNKQSTKEFTLDDIDLLTILGKATGVLLHQANVIKDKMSAARLADVSGRLIKMGEFL